MHTSAVFLHDSWQELLHRVVLLLTLLLSGFESYCWIHVCCVLQGGAQAALAAYMLYLEGTYKPLLYTFGMPQVSANSVVGQTNKAS